MFPIKSSDDCGSVPLSFVVSCTAAADCCGSDRGVGGGNGSGDRSLFALGPPSWIIAALELLLRGVDEPTPLTSTLTVPLPPLFLTFLLLEGLGLLVVLETVVPRPFRGRKLYRPVPVPRSLTMTSQSPSPGRRFR